MTQNVFYLFVVCLSNFNIEEITAAVTSNMKCTGTTYTGENPVSSYTASGPDTNLGFAYMVEDPDYTFSCCGRVTEWQGITANPGVLQLQVWRKMSRDNYVMIGENSYNIHDTAQTTFTFNVDPLDQIVVNKGDFLGWHNEGKEMLVYESVHFTTSTHATMFRRIKTSNLHPGDSYNWSNVEAYNDRRYAIRATTLSSENPVITLTNAVTIPDYIQSGAAITRVSWSDPQVPDNSSLNVYFQQATSFFTMDFPSPTGTGTGYLTAANSPYRPRDSTLTYMAYDTCYNTYSISQTITVQQTDLIINNLPATVTVNETGTDELLLHTITCTDPTDQWYCKSTWSTALPFVLKAITNISYGFYKVEYAVLDYTNTPSYLNLPIECVENRINSQSTATSSISVYVNENQPPRFTNLDANIIVDANVTQRGDVVFWVNATDPEGDDLVYTATYDFQYGRFLVTSNGAVSVTNWLVPQQNLSFSLTITVTDTAGNTDIGYLAISLQNTDYPVSIIGTPNPMQVAENTPNFTTLYKFQYEDLDRNDTKIWSLSFDNPIMTRFFSIDFDTGEFRTNFVEIDYEDLSNVFVYTATVMVGDQKSSATTTFQITITNVNEAPRFTKSYFVIEANENIALTTIESGTLFTSDMVDEDAAVGANGETHEYSLNCSSETHRFLMYPTGQIIFQGPYNLDVSGTPSDVDCEVTVTDRYGLSATAGLHIHVLNYNNFAPQFTQANYTTYVATNTLIGKNVLTVSAIDHDSADDDDNVITYSVRTGTNSHLIEISHTGIIYTAASFASFTSGATLGPIILEAANANHATMSLTGTASIFLVIPQSTTTVTTTTDRNFDFYEDKRNYMWLILAVLGIAVILFTLSLVLFRVCHLARIRPTCYACCMRGICCRPNIQPRGFGDKGYDLASFGHKVRYNDDEMDGWLKADAPNIAGPLAHANDDEDDVNGWLRNVNDTPHYRRPYEDDDGPDARYADQPLYEMFRITDHVPTKAEYEAPADRNTWKNRGSKRPY